MSFVEPLVADVGVRVAPPYSVELHDGFTPVLDLWSRMAERGAASPFQERAWLEAWSRTIGREPGIEMIAATVRDSQGQPVMALPLARRREGLRLVIGFADGGITDYNAPILSPRAPTDPIEARLVWRALLRSLPYSDVVRLRKMPRRVGIRPNPLALLPGTRDATAVGLAVTLPGTYAEWQGALPRRFRMELGRCRRLFDELPGARFERIETTGGDIFAALERLQRERIRTLGHTYILDEAAINAFYRTLADDLANGPGVLTALVTDDGPVAVLFGLRMDTHYVMLRIAAANGEYQRYSLSRQLITRTIEALRGDGVACFDFGLGDYAYKRKLGGEPVELCDLVAATSPLGLADLADFRLRAAVRSSPRLRAGVQRIRGATA